MPVVDEKELGEVNTEVEEELEKYKAAEISDKYEGLLQ